MPGSPSLEIRLRISNEGSSLWRPDLLSLNDPNLADRDLIYAPRMSYTLGASPRIEGAHLQESCVRLPLR